MGADRDLRRIDVCLSRRRCHGTVRLPLGPEAESGCPARRLAASHRPAKQYDRMDEGRLFVARWTHLSAATSPELCIPRAAELVPPPAREYGRHDQPRTRRLVGSSKSIAEI